MSQTHCAAELLFDGPIAEEYNLLHRIAPEIPDMSRRVGEFVGAWAAPAAGNLELLELGTGTGVTTAYLLHHRPDARITSLDNGPTMLEQAGRHLAGAVAEGRLRLVESDALSYLAQWPTASLDLVASAYTVHNFLQGYRGRVFEEIHRVLKPGGVFVNGDRYALDDSLQHLRRTQDEVRGYFREFLAMDRPDLLEQWVLHLFSDESQDHIMRLEPALARMAEAGFQPVTCHYREGVNALVGGVKPWP